MVTTAEVIKHQDTITATAVRNQAVKAEFTVEGAEVGDSVLVNIRDLLDRWTQYTAYVSAANVVTVVLTYIESQYAPGQHSLDNPIDILVLK